MPYPSIYTRVCNFLRDLNNGLVSPEPAKLDAELNNIQLALSQQNAVIRKITTADGRLQNVAQAIAASLVGTASITSDGTVTVTTAIPWTSSFSVNSVLVMQGSALLRPAQITSVQSSGGFLQLTLAAAPALGTLMVVWAFEPGSGLLTRLASTATGEGASLIGIEDPAGLYDAVTVEAALAESAGELAALVVALGSLADYFKRDGSVVATADFDLNGFKIANAADGVLPGDYVTVRQITNYIAAWSDLSRFFLKRDGTTAMAGPMNFGNNKGYNLADPDLNSPLDAVNVRSMQRAIASSGASPVGMIAPYTGSAAPDNWLLCDGQTYKSDAYPVLSNLMGAPYRSGSAQGAITAALANVVSGNLSGGVLTSVPPLLEAGMGYTAPPLIQAISPLGVVYPSQPTFAITVSDVVADGATVTGGTILTITILTGGSGLEAGCSLKVLNAQAASPGSPALATLPSGYFRTPDLRGRTILGAGTESKSPGIIDPPDLTKGDTYSATPRAIGDFGGTEAHRLTEAQMPRHHHQYTFHGNSHRERDGGTGAFYDPNPRTEAYAGGSEAHPNVPPFHVLNYIIKAQ